MRIFSRKSNIFKDIIAGIVVALVSIPISMGYAQIAGLPAVYGLYGSMLPIVVYAIFTTSPQFIVGVDAMPAAMVGGLLAEMGILSAQDKVLKLVPIISLMVALWFVVFYFLKAGRIVKYISTPVMSGFISGVGATIILMQIPKLFGGSAGTGEVFVLLNNIVEQLPKFNFLSCLLGFGTVAVILICKKYIPKVPMTVIMLFVGAGLEIAFHLENYGVMLLQSATPGLPRLSLIHPSVLMDPEISIHIPQIIIQSVSIAGVIMAQTLLATGNYASKYCDKVDNNRELLAYGAMNVAGSLVGCCPVNGSVSRSGIADSFGMRSQLGSIMAGITMVLILLYGTPYLHYLPVPVLTGIVMTALIGIIDFSMMKRLWRDCRNEWVIFMLSFAGVLVFGTVNGVIIGCVLSFWEVAIRAVTPPVAFEGRIPGKGNFYSLSRNKLARPIKNTVIYRFSGNLFFANIDKFISDIESAIKEDTHQVVVDARGVGSVDISAVDRIVSYYNELKMRGIRFYITEHDGSLNDQIRKLGGGILIENGVVRRTITLALRDAGLEKPYDLEENCDFSANDAANDTVNDTANDKTLFSIPMEADDRLSEFEWAFGDQAEHYMEILADKTATEMADKINHGEKGLETIDSHGAVTTWGMLGLFDENEFFDHLEARIEKLGNDGRLTEEDVKWLEERIEARRASGEKRLVEINPRGLELLREHRKKVMESLKESNPEEYEHLKSIYDRMKR